MYQGKICLIAAWKKTKHILSINMFSRRLFAQLVCVI